MSQDLVLLTGATGLVGFRILTELLEQDYKVRLAVRAESKVAALKSALLRTKHAAQENELEFSIVPDMAVSGAFDESVKGGVKFIVHVASPIPAPSDDYEATLIRPAIDTTLTILHSALKEPSVKKVIITSSVAAVIPDMPVEPFDADTVEPDPQGPFTHPFWSYAASKKLALNATRKFIAEQSPRFDVVNVMPSFVIGPNGFAASREEYVLGSNRIALSPLLGLTYPEPRPGFACHVDDVAVVHVAALRSDVSGHHNFGVTYNGPDGIEWDAVVEIVKKRLPGLVEKGVFPLGGRVEAQKVPFDARKTEKILNIKFKTFEDMVVDLASDFARVVAKSSP